MLSFPLLLFENPFTFDIYLLYLEYQVTFRFNPEFDYAFKIKVKSPRLYFKHLYLVSQTMNNGSHINHI